mmetsp:Transcript_30952/g.68563  ORF Transcript_30952/g.68563 Transcript_30952/m.68563 type:complete len:123 (-) Transcript_30952:125-493(-)
MRYTMQNRVGASTCWGGRGHPSLGQQVIVEEVEGASCGVAANVLEAAHWVHPRVVLQDLCPPAEIQIQVPPPGHLKCHIEIRAGTGRTWAVVVGRASAAEQVDGEGMAVVEERGAMGLVLTA